MWHSKRIFVEFPSLSFSYLFAGDSALCRLILKTFSSHYQRAAASSLWCWRARLCDRWVVKNCGTKAVKHGFSPHFTRKSVWIRDSDGIFGPLVHLINSDFIYPKSLKGNPNMKNYVHLLTGLYAFLTSFFLVKRGKLAFSCNIVVAEDACWGISTTALLLSVGLRHHLRASAQT